MKVSLLTWAGRKLRNRTAMIGHASAVVKVPGPTPEFRCGISLFPPENLCLSCLVGALVSCQSGSSSPSKRINLSIWRLSRHLSDKSATRTSGPSLKRCSRKTGFSVTCSCPTPPAWELTENATFQEVPREGDVSKTGNVGIPNQPLVRQAGFTATTADIRLIF